MSLLFLAIEYVLAHTILDAVYKREEKSLKEHKENALKNAKLLNEWKPLSDNELNYIKNLTRR